MTHSYKRDFLGQRFGRLVVKSFVPDDSRLSTWLCVCDCGNEKAVMMQSFVRGLTKSCGCLQSDHMKARAKHGHGRDRTKTRTYSTWCSMMDRCHWGCNKVMFAKYGARGVLVTPAWRHFEGFLADMGERPPGTSLDRIDNAKGYEPSNCRWATRAEQARNTTRNRHFIYGEMRLCMADLCEYLGIPVGRIVARKRRQGITHEQAFRQEGIEVRELPKLKRPPLNELEAEKAVETV